MKENKKPAYIHTSVRIKLVSPSEYPRPTSRDGVATPDTQPNTTGKISITTLIRIRQEKIMFSFQNKKMLLPGRDARKNPCHTSECGGRNTPFHCKCSRSDGNLARGNQILHIQVVYQSFIRLLGYDLCLQRSI